MIAAPLCSLNTTTPRWQQVTIYEDHGSPQLRFMVDTGGKSTHHYYVLNKLISVQLWTELTERLHLAAKGCDASQSADADGCFATSSRSKHTYCI